jgi:hypothetical protein
MTTLRIPVDVADLSEALVTIRGSGGPGADAASGGAGSKTGAGRWRDLHPEISPLRTLRRAINNQSQQRRRSSIPRRKTL